MSTGQTLAGEHCLGLDMHHLDLGLDLHHLGLGLGLGLSLGLGEHILGLGFPNQVAGATTMHTSY